MHEEHVFSVRRTLAVLIIFAALMSLLTLEVFRWVRPTLRDRYFDRGIVYVKAQDFSSAKKEFERAKNLDDRKEATQDQDPFWWSDRMNEVPTDPRIIESYWRSWEVTPVVVMLDETSADFSLPKEALAVGIRLYEAGQPAYAQYAIDRAIELDPTYPEAWHYRYLTYEKLAADNARFRPLADEARTTRDNLTSLYLNP